LPPGAISLRRRKAITTAWSALFGLVLLARQIGWRETRSLVHARKKEVEPDAGQPAESADGSAD
jgi:hypothetical protein